MPLESVGDRVSHVDTSSESGGATERPEIRAPLNDVLAPRAQITKVICYFLKNILCMRCYGVSWTMDNRIRTCFGRLRSPDSGPTDVTASIVKLLRTLRPDVLVPDRETGKRFISESTSGRSEFASIQ